MQITRPYVEVPAYRPRNPRSAPLLRHPSVPGSEFSGFKIQSKAGGIPGLPGCIGNIHTRLPRYLYLKLYLGSIQSISWRICLGIHFSCFTGGAPQACGQDKLGTYYCRTFFLSFFFNLSSQGCKPVALTCLLTILISAIIRLVT